MTFDETCLKYTYKCLTKKRDIFEFEMSENPKNKQTNKRIEGDKKNVYTCIRDLQFKIRMLMDLDISKIDKRDDSLLP